MAEHRSTFVVEETIDEKRALSPVLPGRGLPGLLDCHRLVSEKGGPVVLRTRWRGRDAATAQLPVLHGLLGIAAPTERRECLESPAGVPRRVGARILRGLGAFFEWIPKIGSLAGLFGVLYIWLYARLFAVPDVQLHVPEQSLNAASQEKVAFRFSLRNADQDAPVKVATSWAVADPKLAAGFKLVQDTRTDDLILGPGQSLDVTRYGVAVGGFAGTVPVSFTLEARGGRWPSPQIKAFTITTRIWKPWEVRFVRAAKKGGGCLMSLELHFGTAVPAGWDAQLAVKVPGGELETVDPLNGVVMNEARRFASFTVRETRAMATRPLYVQLRPSDGSPALDCNALGASALAISLERKM